MFFIVVVHGIAAFSRSLTIPCSPVTSTSYSTAFPSTAETETEVNIEKDEHRGPFRKLNGGGARSPKG